MKLKENSYIVYSYVKDHENENITADDIAEATGLSAKQVNGIVTMAFQRHKEEIDGEKVEVPLMERIPGEVRMDANGKPKVPKFIHLTNEGRAIEVEEME